MAECAAFLESRDITIINAECGRSGHRFATWNLVAAFDGANYIPRDKSSYLYDRSIYSSTEDAARKLSADITEWHQGFDDPDDSPLFTDSSDPVLRMPTTLSHMHALHYFHYCWMREKDGDSATEQKERFLRTPFTMEYRRNRIFDHTSSVELILRHTYQDAKYLGEITPACVFADLFWDDMLIRTALIPKRDLASYCEIDIAYTRSNPARTSAGMLKHISSMIALDIDAWHIGNLTQINSPDIEKGLLRIFGKKTVTNNNADLAKALHSKYQDLVGPFETRRASKGIRVESVAVAALDSVAPNHRIRENSRRPHSKLYDVFIAYSQEDSKHALKIAKAAEGRHLRAFRDRKSIQSGQDLSDSIIRAMRQSHALLLLYSPKSQASNWVHLETGAAMALGLDVYPILTHQMKHDDLPIYLTKYTSTSIKLIEKCLDNIELLIRDYEDGYGVFAL